MRVLRSELRRRLRLLWWKCEWICPYILALLTAALFLFGTVGCRSKKAAVTERTSRIDSAASKSLRTVSCSADSFGSRSEALTRSGGVLDFVVRFDSAEKTLPGGTVVRAWGVRSEGKARRTASRTENKTESAKSESKSESVAKDSVRKSARDSVRTTIPVKKTAGDRVSALVRQFLLLVLIVGGVMAIAVWNSRRQR